MAEDGGDAVGEVEESAALAVAEFPFADPGWSSVWDFPSTITEVGAAGAPAVDAHRCSFSDRGRTEPGSAR